MSLPFPPSGPSTLVATIPAYAYQQYTDDDDILGFFAAFNGMAQEFVDWFVNLNLPVYTGGNIVGDLLDWVGEGLYGIARPVLISGRSHTIGPLNTYDFNQLTFNTRKVIAPGNFHSADDDTYKRVLTWHIYKGDGKVFSTRSIKRRIARFLYGVNGTDPAISDPYNISVTFAALKQVNVVLPGSAPGSTIFRDAVRSQVIELPFQYTWNLTIV
jgi:hypothetical protein